MTRLPTLATLGASLLACVLATPTLRADEVVLKDGRTIVGATKKDGKKLVIKTLDGVVTVPLADVDWERTRTDEQLREALARLAMRSGAGRCHAQLELARVAKAWGLYDEMWGYLGKVLRSGNHSPVMQRRTRAFLAELESIVLPAKWHKAAPDIKVRELLYRIKTRVPQAKIAAVTELLAQVPDADKHLRKRAREVRNATQRQASVRALALRPTEGNDRFVYRTAILDNAPSVRRDAMQVTRELGRNEAAISYIAPLLLHDNAKMRIRAAEAFGELRDPAAVPLLVAAGPTAGMMRKALPSGATRAHMAVIQQIAYIRDFDVEVAQASFIANPQVDVLHAGTVLDVTVIAVQTHTVEVVDAYRRAIRRIVNADPGPNPAKWADWLERQKAIAGAAATTLSAPQAGKSR